MFGFWSVTWWEESEHFCVLLSQCLGNLIFELALFVVANVEVYDLFWDRLLFKDAKFIIHVHDRRFFLLSHLERVGWVLF